MQLYKQQWKTGLVALSLSSKEKSLGKWVYGLTFDGWLPSQSGKKFKIIP